MEKIEYGGIVLDVVVTQRFHRSAMRDDVNNYLMTRHEVEAICNYQPALVSYADPLAEVPAITPGKLPGETDLATLNRLLKPRQLLKITAGGSVVLQTPTGQYPCDAQNGPTCEFVSVPKMIGFRHWVVHVRFVAHTNDCKESTSVVLSNTWTSTIDVDELYYPTRSVAGKAILRTDLMRSRHITADDFRRDFFFPIAPNYVRENINVRLAEDGATLMWSFQDVGRCYNVATSSPILKAEIFRSTHSKAGATQLGYRQFLSASVLNVITTQDVMGTVSRGPATEWRFRRNNMPQHVLNIRCDVWGDRNSGNPELTKIALGICLNQAIWSHVPFGLTTTELMCRQELTNRFVSAEMTWRWADEFNAVPAFLIDPVTLPATVVGDNTSGGAVILNSLFTDYPVISGRTIPGNQVVEELFQRDGVNPPLTWHKSTLLESMIVQALLTPCQPVPPAATLTQKS